MSRYYRQKDGEWVAPKMRGHMLGCCDCGLVHRFNFRITIRGPRKGSRYRVPRGREDFRVEFQAFRDKKRTALSRRGRKNVRVKVKP